MALLKSYGFQTEFNSEEFNYSFEIPDNCNFTVSYNATKNYYTVSIQLNSGQTTPSNTYATQTYMFSGFGGIADVRFMEVLNGVTTKKPRITISELNWI